MGSFGRDRLGSSRFLSGRRRGGPGRSKRSSNVPVPGRHRRPPKRSTLLPTLMDPKRSSAKDRDPTGSDLGTFIGDLDRKQDGRPPEKDSRSKYPPSVNPHVYT